MFPSQGPPAAANPAAFSSFVGATNPAVGGFVSAPVFGAPQSAVPVPVSGPGANWVVNMPTLAPGSSAKPVTVQARSNPLDDLFGRKAPAASSPSPSVVAASPFVPASPAPVETPKKPSYDYNDFRNIFSSVEPPTPPPVTEETHQTVPAPQMGFGSMMGAETQAPPATIGTEASFSFGGFSASSPSALPSSLAFGDSSFASSPAPLQSQISFGELSSARTATAVIGSPSSSISFEEPISASSSVAPFSFGSPTSVPPSSLSFGEPVSATPFSFGSPTATTASSIAFGGLVTSPSAVVPASPSSASTFASISAPSLAQTPPSTFSFGDLTTSPAPALVSQISFGDLSAARSPVAPSSSFSFGEPVVAAPAISTFSFDSASSEKPASSSSFSFGEMTTSTAPVLMSSSSLKDFSSVHNSTIPTPTPASTDSPISFGDMTSSANSSAAPVSSFSFGDLASASQPVSPPKTSPQTQNVSSSSFGEFSAFGDVEKAKPTSAFTSLMQVTGLPSLSLPPLPSVHDLQTTFRSLMDQERFDEALLCQDQLHIVQEIEKKKTAHEEAKQRGDDSESCLLKQQIDELVKMTVPLLVSQSWNQPLPVQKQATHFTFAKMRSLLEAETSPKIANKFWSKYHDVPLLVQKGDVKKVLELQREALLRLPLLRTAETEVEASHLKNWFKLLKNCSTELSANLQKLNELLEDVENFNTQQKDQHQDQDSSFKASGEITKHEILAAPKVTAFLRANAEVFRIVQRVKSAVLHYKSSQAFNIPAPFLEHISSSEQLWSQFSSLLRENHFEGAYDANATRAEVAEADWTRETLRQGICFLCLLPVHSDLNHTAPLKWDDELYHSSCANFFCNRISSEPPSRT